MAGPVIVPVRVAGCVMPLIVISPSISTRSPSRRTRSSGSDLGVLLGVEELGRAQVGVQVLVLRLEARDARGAGEPAVGERGVEVVTAPLKNAMPM